MFDRKVLKSETVYNEIKELIITNTLKQGTHLSERNLSESLGASRTPIRDALKKLAYEQFVDSTPEYGNIVSKVTYEQVFQIYDIREMLEALAVRLFTSQASENQLEEIARIYSRLHDSTEIREYKTSLQIDLKFHSYIYTRTKNLQLQRMLDSIFEHTRRILIITRYTDSWAEESLDQHHSLLNYIISRDIQAAEKEMMNHVRNSKRHQLEQLLTNKIG